MNELILYGTVGASFWDEEHFTASEVRAALEDMDGGPLKVRINSGGGVASEGQAIYTALKDYPGEVHVEIDAVAASAASLLAMAGDTITLRLGAYMLIHDPAQPVVWEGRGTEDDHMKLAAQLRVVSNAYAAVYAARAGIDADQARAIMRADTLMDGPAAVEAGFATGHDADTESGEPAAFDYSIYANAPGPWLAVAERLRDRAGKPAILAKTAGEPRMTQEKDMAGNTPSQPQAAGAATQPAAAAAPAAQAASEVVTMNAPAASQAEIDAAASSATQAERQRSARILAAVETAGLPQKFGADLVASAATLEVALQKILDESAKAQTPGEAPTLTAQAPARVTGDARERFAEGAAQAVMAKVGLGGERNEFSSMTLAEMARRSIELVDARVSFGDRREMIGHAFTMAGGQHSTSDFANILKNVMGKAALKGWEEAEETYHLWTAKGTLTDFKETARVGMGLFGDLDKIAEGGEYKYGTVGDRAETIALATYGKIISIGRQAIINDDLMMLGDVPRKMGRGARRHIGNLVYALLTDNPTMSDGTALFHADHANLAGSGGAPSVATLSAARAAMRTQKEKTGDTKSLNIRPAYALCPAALETAFDQLINSTVDPTASKGHARNPVAGMVEVISDARLDDDSATAWYLAANPAAHDTIEVAYLDGIETPYLEEKTGWTRDGVEMKVRIDAAAAPLDFRPLYKNPGA